MKLRINDAITLQEARQRKKNEVEGKPRNNKVITKANLGRLLFPTHKGRAPLVRMSNLIKGVPTFQPQWVHTICKQCKVDPNFLFGIKSEHDKEFKKLK